MESWHNIHVERRCIVPVIETTSTHLHHCEIAQHLNERGTIINRNNMKTEDPAARGDFAPQSVRLVPAAMAGSLAAGLVSWVIISIGFFGLKILMQERPEFVGQPIRVSKAELVQESPQIFIRKNSDDVSVIRPVQPEFSDIQFDMEGRRDYRGLRTIMDMSGQFHARYLLTNIFDEPIFVLFRCPHPRNRNDENLLAGELKLQAATDGLQENTKDAWIWSGSIEARGSTSIEVSYHASTLNGVSYRVGEKSGNQVKRLRVAVQRKDLPSMRFESGDGLKQSPEQTVIWERKDFLAPDVFTAEIGESRNLFASLSQLLEIGPVICLLFLIAVSAAILLLQPLTAVQMLTIAAGYALYFPLMLYLSSRFSFAVALIIAVVVPGALLVNYARWLLGARIGLVAAPLFLLLYQVFPTLAAFAGWNRGMVLLWLGVVTLAVLISLQNRALKKKAAAIATALGLFALSFNLSAAEIQVTLPAELVARPETKHTTTNTIIAFEPGKYQASHEATYILVTAELPFRVLRAGETTVPLFNLPVHLQEVKFEPPDLAAQLVSVTNRLELFCTRTGQATMRLSFRVPITNHEGKKRAQVPIALGSSGNIRLESPRSDIEFLSGSLWAKKAGEKSTVYDIGVAGLDALMVEWREQGDGAPVVPEAKAGATREFYGIGLTHAQNLTVINSDGSCAHFAEFELPVLQAEDFRMKLPAQARLISVSVNGAEIGSPSVVDQLVRIKLPGREGSQTAHRVSFRIACPPIKLGFIGTADLALPELFQTAGTLEWVVALPNGFDAQVVSSGLETQKSAPDLSRFGDYGRILKSQSNTYLAKSLAPPGAVSLSLKYRQTIP